MKDKLSYGDAVHPPPPLPLHTSQPTVVFNSDHCMFLADVAALADIVHRVSLLAAHLGPRLKELDVNPVIVRAAGEGALAVDARAVWTIME